MINTVLAVFGLALNRIENPDESTVENYDREFTDIAREVSTTQFEQNRDFLLLPKEVRNQCIDICVEEMKRDLTPQEIKAVATSTRVPGYVTAAIKQAAAGKRAAIRIENLVTDHVLGADAPKFEYN